VTDYSVWPRELAVPGPPAQLAVCELEKHHVQVSLSSLVTGPRFVRLGDVTA
jgi:hypothetical protein